VPPMSMPRISEAGEGGGKEGGERLATKGSVDGSKDANKTLEPGHNTRKFGAAQTRHGQNAGQQKRKKPLSGKG